jgi:sarcosine oxidase subunit alpha
MRLEKGFVSSDEIDGSTTAQDLGLGRMMSRKKDFIGRVLAERPALAAPDRPAIAGVKPVDRTARFNAGAHLMPVAGPADPAADQGHVTSAAWSPTLGHWIGLCLVKGGGARLGERLRTHDPVRGGDVEVEICDPAFYDPGGERIRG